MNVSHEKRVIGKEWGNMPQDQNSRLPYFDDGVKEMFGASYR